MQVRLDALRAGRGAANAVTARIADGPSLSLTRQKQPESAIGMYILSETEVLRKVFVAHGQIVAVTNQWGGMRLKIDANAQTMEVATNNRANTAEIHKTRQNYDASEICAESAFCAII